MPRKYKSMFMEELIHSILPRLSKTIMVCCELIIIEKESNMAIALLRNMKVLEHTRSFLTPMKEKLEKAIE